MYLNMPRSEVGLIFAELGRVSGIFSNEVYAGMVIVIAHSPRCCHLLEQTIMNESIRVRVKSERGATYSK